MAAAAAASSSASPLDPSFREEFHLASSCDIEGPFVGDDGSVNVFFMEQEAPIDGSASPRGVHVAIPAATFQLFRGSPLDHILTAYEGRMHGSSSNAFIQVGGVTCAVVHEASSALGFGFLVRVLSALQGADGEAAKGVWDGVERWLVNTAKGCGLQPLMDEPSAPPPSALLPSLLLTAAEQWCAGSLRDFFWDSGTSVLFLGTPSERCWGDLPKGLSSLFAEWHRKHFSVADRETEQRVKKTRVRLLPSFTPQPTPSRPLPGRMSEGMPPRVREEGNGFVLHGCLYCVSAFNVQAPEAFVSRYDAHTDEWKPCGRLSFFPTTMFVAHGRAFFCNSHAARLPKKSPPLNEGAARGGEGPVPPLDVGAAYEADRALYEARRAAREGVSRQRPDEPVDAIKGEVVIFDGSSFERLSPAALLVPTKAGVDGSVVLVRFTQPWRKPQWIPLPPPPPPPKLIQKGHPPPPAAAAAAAPSSAPPSRGRGRGRGRQRRRASRTSPAQAWVPTPPPPSQASMPSLAIQAHDHREPPDPLPTAIWLETFTPDGKRLTTSVVDPTKEPPPTKVADEEIGSNVPFWHPEVSFFVSAGSPFVGVLLRLSERLGATLTNVRMIARATETELGGAYTADRYPEYSPNIPGLLERDPRRGDTVVALSRSRPPKSIAGMIAPKVGCGDDTIAWRRQEVLRFRVVHYMSGTEVRLDSRLGTEVRMTPEAVGPASQATRHDDGPHSPPPTFPGVGGLPPGFLGPPGFGPPNRRPVPSLQPSPSFGLWVGHSAHSLALAGFPTLWNGFSRPPKECKWRYDGVFHPFQMSHSRVYFFPELRVGPAASAAERSALRIERENLLCRGAREPWLLLRSGVLPCFSYSLLNDYMPSAIRHIPVSLEAIARGGLMSREHEKSCSMKYDDDGNPTDTPAPDPQQQPQRPQSEAKGDQDPLTGLGKSKGRLLAYVDLLASSQGEYKDAGLFPGSHQDFRLDASPFCHVASFSLPLGHLFAIREGTTLYHIAQHGKTQEPPKLTPAAVAAAAQQMAHTGVVSAIRMYLTRELGLAHEAAIAFESSLPRAPGERGIDPPPWAMYAGEVGIPPMSMYGTGWSAYPYGAPYPYGGVSDAGVDDDDMIGGDGASGGSWEDELDEEDYDEDDLMDFYFGPR